MKPTVLVDDHIAEVGRRFEGRVTFASDLDTRVRGVRLRLQWQTESRATNEHWTSPQITMPMSPLGLIDERWSLDVPWDAPISYRGQLLRLDWTIGVTVDLERRPDETWVEHVVVIPRNGRGRYHGPHPLPS